MISWSLGRYGAILSTWSVVLSSPAYGQVVATPVSVEASHLGDTSHLEFKGRDVWPYEVRREGDDKVVLIVPPLDAKSQLLLKSFSSPLIKSITIDEKALNDQFQIQFVLRNKAIQSFDYQTDQPPRLVLDFFKQHETATNPPAAAKANPDGVKLARGPKSKILKVSSVATRTPASADFMAQPAGEGDDEIGSAPTFKGGIFDGADPELNRFRVKDYEIKESAIIASQQNIYLRFPMLKLESRTLKTIVEHPPIYQLDEADTQENREARLLKTLFERKRTAAFAKTYQFFNKRFPQSQYQEMLRYMAADFQYEHWSQTQKAEDFEKAMSSYRDMLGLYPDSPLFERTALLVAFSYLERGDAMSALRELQKFFNSRPQSAFHDPVQIAIAECLIQLNKPDEAVATLQQLKAHATKQKYATEASYRLGDIAFQNRDYAAATSAYQQALTAFPDAWAAYPNAYFNQAESLFWLGRYRESLDGYREYLKRFSSETYGGYTMTRLAELLEILGVDQRRVMGAFLESYFRYSNTPGGKIARVRLLSQRIKNMKPKELEKALKEVEQITKESQLAEMPEFVSIVVSDGLYRRGEYAQAVDRLTQFYQSNPSSKNLSFIENRIVRAITQNIKTEIDQGNFMEALKTYSHFAPTWLKNADRIDVRYYVGRGFEQAGAFGESSRLYSEVLNRIYSLAGTPFEKQRNVFEVLPTTESLNLRMAATRLHQGEYARALEHLGQIAHDDKLSPPERVEKVEIAAEVADKTGRRKDAIRYLSQLIDTWSGQPQEVASPLLRLAQLHSQNGETARAQGALTRVLNLKTDTQLVPEDVDAKALELSGDLLAKTKKTDDALEAYSQLLNQYEKKRPLASVRYRAGDLEFKRGNTKAAEKLWGPLEADANKIWSKMAQEQLHNDQFRTDYRKYINRIPAMATMKDGAK